MIEEQKFDIIALRKHCRELFGVQPEVFDGAFALETRREFSKEEAKEKIDNFLKKEVK
jgi:hypothetical protein